MDAHAQMTTQTHAVKGEVKKISKPLSIDTMSFFGKFDAQRGPVLWDFIGFFQLKVALEAHRNCQRSTRESTMREILGTFQWSNCEKVTIALKNGSIDVFVDGRQGKKHRMFFRGGPLGKEMERICLKIWPPKIECECEICECALVSKDVYFLSLHELFSHLKRLSSVEPVSYQWRWWMMHDFPMSSISGISISSQVRWRCTAANQLHVFTGGTTSGWGDWNLLIYWYLNQCWQICICAYIFYTYWKWQCIYVLIYLYIWYMYNLTMLKYEGYKTIHVRCKSKTKKNSEKKKWTFPFVAPDRSCESFNFFFGREKKTTLFSWENSSTRKNPLPGGSKQAMEFPSWSCSRCIYEVSADPAFFTHARPGPPAEKNRGFMKTMEAQTVVFQGFVGGWKFSYPVILGIIIKPLKGSLLTNQDDPWKVGGFFFAEAEAPSVFFFLRRRVVPSWKGHQRFFGGLIVSVWGVNPGSLTYPLKMDSRKTGFLLRR